MNILFRRLSKSKSLRIVNLAGLAIVFACLLLSYGYVKKELSYDRFHANAGRIYRLTLQYDDFPVDGRIYNYSNEIDAIVKQMPEVEEVLTMENIANGVLTHQGEQQIVRNFNFVDPHFFEFFSFKLLQGEKHNL